MIKFIDLFAGIGGFRYGIERANDITKTRGFGQEKELPESGSGNSSGEPNKRQHTFSCVYSNEWDKYAAQIYRKHYGKCDERDITTVPALDIPDHDLLVGGFPCQAFSIAGRRRGFADTRGTLFFEIARILKDKSPRLVLLENVKGLLSHNNGNTFKTIISTLDELGYDLQWQVLNSKNFGVPQNRERVFIIGHLRGTSRPQVFPITGTSKSGVASTAIDANYWKGIDNHGARTAILTDEQSTQEVRDQSDHSNTIRRTSYSDGMRIRRLTPTECERLQGFPDGWTEGISDTQRYKCLGNAVTTNVVTVIIERMFVQ